MSQHARLIIAGILAFLVALAAELPAATAIQWLAPDSVRASGITGTFWNGSAHDIGVGGVRLSETRWRLSPFSLLLGRLAGNVDTRVGDGAARGSMSISLPGRLTCSDCRYEGPVSGLRPLFPALNSIDGQIIVELVILEIRDRWPTRAVGAANLSEVLLSPSGAGGGNPTAAAFTANVNADPIADSGVIEATVQDNGGPLELSARLMVTPPGAFEFAGRAKARPGAPADVVNALTMLGGRAADGSTELSVSGTF